MRAVRHVGIVVSDLERSLRFYEKLLGLKVVKRAEEVGEFIDKVCGLDKTRLITVKLAADDGSLVEILSFNSHAVKKIERQIYDIGVSHVAFTVNDIDREYSKLCREGIKFISPPSLSPDGLAKVAFCKDPDGVYIELVEPVN